MTTDALAALLCLGEGHVHRGRRAKDGIACEQHHREAVWLSERGVRLDPPDHPLRTGEPSEAMHEAAMDVFRAHPGVWVNRDDEWLERALRAALAVLREGQ